MTRCKTCNLSACLHTVSVTGSIWCSFCGTIIEKQHDGSSETKIPQRVQKPGLLLLAAQAIARVNERVATQMGGGRCPENAEDLAEAIAAIIHELEARSDDDREPTAAERADLRSAFFFPAPPNWTPRQWEKRCEELIAIGVKGIQQERERCAQIAESFDSVREGWIGGSAGPELAKRIRKVPT